jgi:thiamine-monophosphate kinase
MDTLANIGERAAIDRLTSVLGKNASVIVGPGDDCAVIRTPGDSERDWLLTSDPVIEGVHFEPGTNPELIGRKSAGRVLSDIAAMGGTPSWLLLDIVAPPDRAASDPIAAAKGAAALASSFGAAVVGGDLSAGPCLEVHAFAVGWVPRGKAVLRSGARSGDRIFVTGTLGGSRLNHHLTFIPRLQAGLVLRDWVSSMIDVSDGLSTELAHLASCSAVGFEVEDRRIPLDSDTNSLDAAFTDGEDFELLFTVPPERVEAFQSAWRSAQSLRVTDIGITTPHQGFIARRHPDGTLSPVIPDGFEHFRKNTGRHA